MGRGFVNNLMDDTGRNHHNIALVQLIGLAADEVAAPAFGQIIHFIVWMVVRLRWMGDGPFRNLKCKIASHINTAFDI